MFYVSIAFFFFFFFKGSAAHRILPSSPPRPSPDPPILSAPPQPPPLEPCRLPIRAPEGGSGLIGNDVPARDGKREVELADSQHTRSRHEVHVPGRLPDPRAADEAQGRREP